MMLSMNSILGIGFALALVLSAVHPAEAAQTYCEARLSSAWTAST